MFGQPNCDQSKDLNHTLTGSCSGHKYNLALNRPFEVGDGQNVDVGETKCEANMALFSIKI